MSPAQINATSPINSAKPPQKPGKSRKRKAVKWMTIIIQPVSQTPETGVGLRLDTDAKAAVKRATAARSGISLQFTHYTSRQGTAF
jgi:hypothetical protein